jgi:hypothetical protein
VRGLLKAGRATVKHEAPYVEVVRTRKFTAGVPHDAVERQLESAHSPQDMMALALFGSSSRGGDVVARASAGRAAVHPGLLGYQTRVHDPMEET